MKSIEKVSFKKGSMIIREDLESRKLYIIKSGKVQVFKSHIDGHVPLAILGPGELFGEISFFDAKKRSASVVALTDIEADCIDGNDISSEIEKLPNWIIHIFKAITDRFREVDDKLTYLEGIYNKSTNQKVYNDTIEKVLTEITRQIKIIKILIENEGTSFDYDNYIERINETTGKSIITPKALTKQLINFDIASRNYHQIRNPFEFHTQKLDDFERFLSSKIEKGDIYIPSNKAISILLRLIRDTQVLRFSNKDTPVKVPPVILSLKDHPDMKEGYQELLDRSFLIEDKQGVTFVTPKTLTSELSFHRIVKALTPGSFTLDNLE